MEEVAGDRDPSALTRGLRAVRVRCEQRDRDRRMRLLIGPWDPADLELGIDVLLEPDLPELSVDPVRRIVAPELQNDVDRFEHHLRPRFRLPEVEHPEAASEPDG